MKTTILLVRHGETESNRLRILQGILDVPLNDTGTAQAAKLAEKMSFTHIDAIYSSDLARALVTAEHIAKNHKQMVNVDSRLKEFDSGVFAGMSQQHAQEKHPRAWREYRLDSAFVVPGGESYDGFCSRVCDAFEDITEKHLGQTVCIVAHGGVLDCLCKTYFSAANIGAGKRCGNASLSTVQWDNNNNTWTVLVWNDVDHLNQVEQSGADDVRG